MVNIPIATKYSAVPENVSLLKSSLQVRSTLSSGPRYLNLKSLEAYGYPNSMMSVRSVALMVTLSVLLNAGLRHVVLLSEPVELKPAVREKASRAITWGGESYRL